MSPPGLSLRPRLRIVGLLALIATCWFGVLLAQPALAPRVQVALLPADWDVQQAVAAAENFQAVDAEAVRIPASGDDGVLWLRIEADPAQRDSPQLSLERVVLDRLEAWGEPGLEPLGPPLSLFDPEPQALLASRYVIPWPGTAQSVLLRLQAPTTQQASLQLSDERDLLRAERSASVIAAGSYAAILATMLASLALTLAVGRPVFRFYTGFAAIFLLFLLAADGVLFEFAPFAWLGAQLGVKLVFLLGLSCMAAALAFAHRLLDLAAQSSPLSRWSDRAAWALLGLGVLSLVVPSAWLGVAASLVWALMLAAAVLPVAIATWSWSLGSLFSAVLCLLWAGILAVMATRLAALAGWLVADAAVRAAYQSGAALAVIGLSIALTERVIALRRQVEQIQLAHAESSASLQLEQQRRQFAAALRELSSSVTASGDLEWRAFRLLIQTIGDLLANRSIGLSATGYRGFDYLLAEPMNSKARLCTLLADRSATLKGICRSRTTMQLPLDVSESGREALRGQFAVVPLIIPRPGWGAMVIEREAGQEFSSSELGLASEFAELTVHVIEESALKADLRRTADVDPLTSLLNRRAGEARLETLLLAARTEKASLCLLFVDFDLFRPINERHGVGVGDQCLRLVADALRPLVGSGDLLARYGGDEFLIALPGRDLDQASELAERVRGEVAALRIKTDQGPIKLTVSIGLTAADPATDTVSRMVDRAERASSTAKGKGRNQVQLLAGGGQVSHGDAPKIPGF